MADNIDLAIRIRADLQSALQNLGRMEKGVRGLDGEMRKASRGGRLLHSTIGKFVAGDLIARGFVALARNVQQMGRSVVQAGTDMESLAAAMRSAVGNDAALVPPHTRG